MGAVQTHPDLLVVGAGKQWSCFDFSEFRCVHLYVAESFVFHSEPIVHRAGLVCFTKQLFSLVFPHFSEDFVGTFELHLTDICNTCLFSSVAPLWAGNMIDLPQSALHILFGPACSSFAWFHLHFIGRQEVLFMPARSRHRVEYKRSNTSPRGSAVHMKTHKPWKHPRFPCQNVFVSHYVSVLVVVNGAECFPS